MVCIRKHEEHQHCSVVIHIVQSCVSLHVPKNTISLYWNKERHKSRKKIWTGWDLNTGLSDHQSDSLSTEVEEEHFIDRLVQILSRFESVSLFQCISTWLFRLLIPSVFRVGSKLDMGLTSRPQKPEVVIAHTQQLWYC